MPDLYSAVTNLDPAVAKQLGDAMELRATEPAQQAMLAAYLEDIDLPDGAAVVEIECALRLARSSGTSLTRALPRANRSN